MEVKDWIELVTNNGVAIAMIVYFAIRDWKFNLTLQSTLTSLVNAVETLKELIKERN